MLHISIKCIYRLNNPSVPVVGYHPSRTDVPMVPDGTYYMFSELGMDINTAFNIFVRECLCIGGFPFEIKLEESDKIINPVKIAMSSKRQLDRHPLT